jgi:hypothetical protein
MTVNKSTALLKCFDQGRAQRVEKVDDDPSMVAEGGEVQLADCGMVLCSLVPHVHRRDARRRGPVAHASFARRIGAPLRRAR